MSKCLSIILKYISYNSTTFRHVYSIRQYIRLIYKTFSSCSKTVWQNLLPLHLIGAELTLSKALGLTSTHGILMEPSKHGWSVYGWFMVINILTICELCIYVIYIGLPSQYGDSLWFVVGDSLKQHKSQLGWIEIPKWMEKQNSCSKPPKKSSYLPGDSHYHHLYHI